MNLNEKNIDCQIGCCALGFDIGLVTIIACVLSGATSWTGAIILGSVATGVSGLVMGLTICLHLENLQNAVLGEPSAGALDEQSRANEAPANDAAKPSTAKVVDPIIPSVELAGDVELAKRKGAWKYQPNRARENNPVSQTGQECPSCLDDPIGRIDNNFKKIRGIGPKLEKLCNSMGFYHFIQITAWTAQDVAWANYNLVGFKGWVVLDNWVDQAKASLRVVQQPLENPLQTVADSRK